MNTTNVGIIVEDHGYDVALWPDGDQRKFSNSPNDLKDLLDYTQAIDPRHIVVLGVATDTTSSGENNLEVEAQSLVRVLREAGLSTDEAAPWQARYYLGLGEKAQLTALNIARLAQRVENSPSQLRLKQPKPLLAQRWPPFPAIVEPERTESLWRYMTFVKFASLLDSSSLFFSRADLLGDKHEGSLPLQQPRHSIDEDRLVKLKQLNQNHTYVNCWVLSECENSGMWSNYAGGDLGVAIKTTYGRLFDSILETPLSDSISFTKVTYLDYSTDRFGGLVPDVDLFTPYS